MAATGLAQNQPAEKPAAPKQPAPAAKAPAKKAAGKQVGDGPAYPVSQVLLDFSSDLPVHPPTRQLMGLEVALSESPSGYTAPKAGSETKRIKLADVPKLNAKFHASALAAIGQRLSQHFAEWGYTGIVVTPHKDEIDAAGKDIRGEGATALRLVIRTDGTWAGVPGRPDETVTAPSYKVTQFIVSFDPAVPRRPPVSEVMRYEVDLGEVSEGYVGPRPGGKAVRVRLGDVAGLPKHDFYPSAIKTVGKRIAEQMKTIGFGDYDVIPHPADIDAEGKDTRFPNQTALRLLVRPQPQVVEAPPVETPVPAPAVAEKPREIVKATEKDGKPYNVSQVIIEYAEQHPAHPELRSTMEEVAIALAETDKGYVAAPQGVDPIVVRLVEIPLLSKPVLYGSAIQAISRGIVAHYSSRGYIGINVAPHPEDIDATASDARPEGITALRMLVRIGRVTEVRTIAAGERVDETERMNNPLHQRLVQRSPVAPDAADAGGEQGKDLLRKDQLDRYINWLNRHPGRRVDVAVSPSQQPGGVALDFLVTENKPWTIYAQISNTGTEQTDDWRERFGFIHNQLTNNDDTLALDYVTADFETSHAFIGSYEAPFFNFERVRWRVFGTWSEFTASDVGFANERFTGTEWAVGGDMIFNIYQHDQWFVDLVAGAKYQKDTVNNEGLNVSGEDTFILPHVGLQTERYTETSTLFAMVDLEINAKTDNSTADIEALGRPGARDDFWRAKYDATYSMYLEPLIFGDAWNDPSQPEKATLAHELAFMARGQYSPHRNVPQFERSVGGMYSVRGYDESIVAGDTSIILTAEYRFHLPRVFTPEPDPRELFGKPFRVAPQHVYGRPDWDLVFRGFVDWAHVWNNDEKNFETDYDLASVGVGAELLLKRNINIRVDWGYVLEGIEARVEEGNSRFHIVATFLY